MPAIWGRSSAARIADLVAKDQNLKRRFQHIRGMKKPGLEPPFPAPISTDLPANVPATRNQVRGGEDKAVAAGVFVAADWGHGGGNGPVR
jgi:hypothetical protein